MRTPKPLFTVIASTIAAIRNCEQSGNVEWLARHRETLCEFRSFLPHGSGFDTGFTIDDSESNENRLVLEFDFHHMDEHGFYVGWTSHKVIVTPSLVSGFDFEIETDDEQKTGEQTDDGRKIWTGRRGSRFKAREGFAFQCAVRIGHP